MEAASRPAFEPLSDVGPELSAPPGPAAHPVAPSVAAPRAPVPANMDRDFIARNQIVERYLSGKLPVKGASDFERFCSEHPELLDELGLPERVNAGLRLLEAAGKPEPWQEAPKRFWEKPQFTLGLGVAVLVMLIAVAALASSASSKSSRIAKLERQVKEQPLEAAATTRTIRLVPSRTGGSNSPVVAIGGASSQLADLKIDMSRSDFRNFRVTIDRIDQGRVAILHNLAKDSNGHLRIALNSSAFGPGNYQMTIEGITWRGETVPDAWVTIAIVR
jgi:hypothetical protein